MTSVTWCEAGPPPNIISAAIQVPVNGANGRGVGATQDETCAHGRSGPHIASCDAPTARRDASHLSWLVVCSPGVRRRWRTVGGSGTVARGSFETHASAWLQEANNDDSEDQTGASTEITAMIAVQAGRSRYTMHCYCAAPGTLSPCHPCRWALAAFGRVRLPVMIPPAS